MALGVMIEGMGTQVVFALILLLGGRGMEEDLSELDEAFFRELEELSCSKVLVLMGDYNDVNDLLEGQQQGTRDLGNCWSPLMTTS